MQSGQLKRREFISLFGGTLVVWSNAARTQEATTPVVGYMSARTPEDSKPELEAFKRGLREEGSFVEGCT
jgi:putative tryptophan/tyrosine transport system substrate-binding protein